MADKIKVMIAEDEWLARKELTYLLRQEEDLEHLPDAVNGRELLELVQDWKPDVVFLDVQMPELAGMQAAHLLKEMQSPPLIVFTTAHEDYAVEAFGIGAIDYLLKPYSQLRLKETLGRIRAKFSSQTILSPSLKKPLSALSGGKLNKLLITEGEKHVLIDPEMILYCVREEKSIRIYTTADQIFTSKFTLQELIDKLNSYSFFRPHRSYLVNLNLIDELIPWFNGAFNLVLKDTKRTQIPVSRDMAKELFKLLKGG